MRGRAKHIARSPVPACPCGGLRIVLLASLLLAGGPPTRAAGDLYRYQDAQGNWVFSDRPPEGDQEVEQLERPGGETQPGVTIERIAAEDGLTLAINNSYACPVELVLEFTRLQNIAASIEPVQHLVLGAQRTEQLRLPSAVGNQPFDVQFRTAYLPGDPEAVHAPERPYRVPYALSTAHRVTQGFNGQVTHLDPSSFFAVDIAMPVGTGIFAARGGIVIETAYANYAGGTDRERDGPRANIVRIMHDDGTFAVYAHLERASVRVRPGDRVRTGQYIADSGNTGFSSGPHLHFVIMRNSGLQMTSMPFRFTGPENRAVEPRAGEMLTAYP